MSADTLDPRPETETLVEAVLKRKLDKCAPLHILDLGTGTGCLLLALLAEYPRATGVGIDIAEPALRTAIANGARLGIADRPISWSAIGQVRCPAGSMRSSPIRLTSEAPSLLFSLSKSHITTLGAPSMAERTGLPPTGKLLRRSQTFWRRMRSLYANSASTNQTRLRGWCRAKASFLPLPREILLASTVV